MTYGLVRKTIVCPRLVIDLYQQKSFDEETAAASQRLIEQLRQLSRAFQRPVLRPRLRRLMSRFQSIHADMAAELATTRAAGRPTSRKGADRPRAAACVNLATLKPPTAPCGRAHHQGV